MNYLSKRLSRLPFTVTACIRAATLAIFSGLIGSVIIYTRANFEITGTKKIFIFSYFIYVMIFFLITLVEYGGLRFLRIKEKKGIRILNENIKEEKVRQDISIETLKEVFSSLSKLPEAGIRIVLGYGTLVVSLLLLTEWLLSRKTINLPIIFFGGSAGLILALSSGILLGDRILGPLFKKCRLRLLEKGEKVKEKGFIITLKRKFYLLLLFPIIIILGILIFIPYNLSLIFFSLYALVLIVIVNQLLFSTINQAFAEVGEFAKDLPKGKKLFYVSGSTMKEIMEMTESLNEAAAEIYRTREELEEAKTVLEIKVQARTRELRELAASLEKQVKERTKELQERITELEKLHKFTVGRELKMVELKEEIEKFKKELKKVKK